MKIKITSSEIIKRDSPRYAIEINKNEFVNIEKVIDKKPYVNVSSWFSIHQLIDFMNSVSDMFPILTNCRSIRPNRNRKLRNPFKQDILESLL